MSNPLTPSDLLHQAVLTAHSYLSSAIRIIDDEFGEGYAKAHPELVAGFMHTAAMDFDSCMERQALNSLASDIGDIAIAINNLSSSIDRFLPPVEEFINNMPRGRKK